MQESINDTSIYKEVKETICNCHKVNTEDLRPCPYQMEIHDNYEDYCNCCEVCEQECQEEI